MKRKEYAKTRFLDRLFRGVPDSRKVEIEGEIRTRHVVLVESSSDFVKTTNQKIQQRRSRDILQALASKSWRQSQNLDDFNTMDITYETMHEIHFLWLEYMESILPRNQPGIPRETLKGLDFHGAKLQINQCKDPQLVGLEGLVFGLDESNFWILEASNRKFKIPLRKTELVLKLRSRELRLIGCVLMNDSKRKLKA